MVISITIIIVYHRVYNCFHWHTTSERWKDNWGQSPLELCHLVTVRVLSCECILDTFLNLKWLAIATLTDLVSQVVVCGPPVAYP